MRFNRKSTDRMKGMTRIEIGSFTSLAQNKKEPLQIPNIEPIVSVHLAIWMEVNTLKTERSKENFFSMYRNCFIEFRQENCQWNPHRIRVTKINKMNSELFPAYPVPSTSLIENIVHEYCIYFLCHLRHEILNLINFSFFFLFVFYIVP